MKWQSSKATTQASKPRASEVTVRRVATAIVAVGAALTCGTAAASTVPYQRSTHDANNCAGVVWHPYLDWWQGYSNQSGRHQIILWWRYYPNGTWHHYLSNGEARPVWHRNVAEHHQIEFQVYGVDCPLVSPRVRYRTSGT